MKPIIICNEDNILSKPCALGSVGFPSFALWRHHQSSFLLSKTITPNRHLVHTIIPKILEMNNSLEDFLNNLFSISLFCKVNFISRHLN